MQHADNAVLVQRADELLWVMARCDVEGVSAHRERLLERLFDLETRNSQLHLPDLYEAVVSLEESEAGSARH